MEDRDGTAVAVGAGVVDRVVSYRFQHGHGRRPHGQAVVVHTDSIDIRIVGSEHEIVPEEHVHAAGAIWHHCIRLERERDVVADEDPLLRPLGRSRNGCQEKHRQHGDG